MMTVPRLVLIILASAILTAACGGDDEDSPEPTPSPEPSEATQVTTSPASRDSLPAGTHTSENCSGDDRRGPPQGLSARPVRDAPGAA